MKKKFLISESNGPTRAALQFACERLSYESQVVERIPTKAEFLQGVDGVIAGFVASSTVQACRSKGIDILVPTCYLPLAERETMSSAELAGGIQFIKITGSLPMRLKAHYPDPAPETEGEAPTSEEDILSLGDTQVGETTTEAITVPEATFVATVGDEDVPF